MSSRGKMFDDMKDRGRDESILGYQLIFFVIDMSLQDSVKRRCG